MSHVTLPHRSRPLLNIAVLALALASLLGLSLLGATSPAQGQDSTPPTTTVELEGAQGVNGVYRGPVTVRVAATDDVAVASTEYRLDGGEWALYSNPEVPILDETQESFDQWETVGNGEFERLPDGSVQGFGFLGMLWYPVEDYGDVAVRLQYRDMTGQGNAGVFMRFPDVNEAVARAPEDRYACQTGQAETAPEWVAIQCGHELQINESPADAQKTGSVYNFKPVLESQGTVPGVWRDYELRTVGDGSYALTLILDGEVINEFVNTPGQVAAREGDPPTDDRQFARGHIGLQAHVPGDVVMFRDIRVQDLSEPDPVVVTGDGEHTIEVRSTDISGAVEEPHTVTFTIGEPAVVHIDEGDPVATGVAVSQATFDAADAVVLARADVFADALTSGPLAGALDAPVLLTGGDQLDPAVAAEIERLGATTAYLAGGTAALSADVEGALAGAGLSTTRLGGATRFHTAARIAEELEVVAGPADQAIVALGQRSEDADAWPDALAAGQLAGLTRSPILLATPDGVPGVTLDAIQSTAGPGSPVALSGGEAALGPEVAAALEGAGHDLTRLAGETRYGTAVAIANAAREAGAGGDPLYVVSGQTFTGALVGVPAALADNATLVLSDPDALDASPATAAHLAEQADAISQIIVIGPVSESLLLDLEAALAG